MLQSNRTSNSSFDEPETPTQNGRSPVLLIVDDEPGIVEAYCHYLDPPDEQRATPRLRSSRRRSASRADSAGNTCQRYELLTANTGEDAVDQVRQRYQLGHHVDIGFFDMKMPGGIDGLETIRRVLEIDPEVHCVIVTAYQDKPLTELAKVFGPARADQWDYISKPFTRNEIVQKVRNLLAVRKRRYAQRRRESGLHKAVAHYEGAAETRAEELALANEQLRAKHEQLQRALGELTETNSRLQDEMAEKARIEQDLRMAHKLEAVGQLAAGIAHEISTPTQYMGNNVQFLAEAFEDLKLVIDRFGKAYHAQPDTDECLRLLSAAHAEAESISIDYLFEEIPDAFDAVSEGIKTISTIVGAMRNFAHPDSQSKDLGDINHAIENTLAVAHSECRYAATIDLQLGEIPLVPCYLGGLNQALLNLIVNAAHAVVDAGKDADTGVICIRSWADIDEGFCYVSIRDNGTGMDNETREKIFDPFFTTKEVGRGTGQGLGITRDILVNKHKGRLEIDSEPGRGTTFTIALPL